MTPSEITDSLRHSRISLTADLHAQMMEDAKQQAAGKMDALFGRRPARAGPARRGVR